MAVLPVPNSGPVVHDCRGRDGWPVLMYAANGDYEGLLVVHSRKDVRAGHQMIVGENVLTQRRYWVVQNVPNPKRANRLEAYGAYAFMAELHMVWPPGPVTVAGITYQMPAPSWEDVAGGTPMMQLAVPQTRPTRQFAP